MTCILLLRGVVEEKRESCFKKKYALPVSMQAFLFPSQQARKEREFTFPSFSIFPIIIIIIIWFLCRLVLGSTRRRHQRHVTKAYDHFLRRRAHITWISYFESFLWQETTGYLSSLAYLGFFRATNNVLIENVQFVTLWLVSQDQKRGQSNIYAIWY